MSMITEKAIETLEIEAGAVEALKGRIGEEFEAAVQCILDCTARVVVTGMGKSGHIGRKRPLPAPALLLSSCIPGRPFTGIWAW